MQDDHKVGIVGILCVTGFLCWAIFSIRTCDVNKQHVLSKKLSALEEKNQTLVTQIKECRLLCQGNK